MWPCIVRIHDQLPFTFIYTPSNDLGQNISDIVGGLLHLSFWHGMPSTTWNTWGFQTSVQNNFGF
jgi:hypothetical protein